jgi:hypothetical protein
MTAMDMNTIEVEPLSGELHSQLAGARGEKPDRLGENSSMRFP